VKDHFTSYTYFPWPVEASLQKGGARVEDYTETCSSNLLYTRSLYWRQVVISVDNLRRKCLSCCSSRNLAMNASEHFRQRPRTSLVRREGLTSQPPLHSPSPTCTVYYHREPIPYSSTCPSIRGNSPSCLGMFQVSGMASMTMNWRTSSSIAHLSMACYSR
jgi:hypothetical protein